MRTKTPSEVEAPERIDQTPEDNRSIGQAAAGNLAFLLSVIRCGETLSAKEEASVRDVIKRLGVSRSPVDEALQELREIFPGEWVHIAQHAYWQPEMNAGVRHRVEMLIKDLNFEAETLAEAMAQVRQYHKEPLTMTIGPEGIEFVREENK